MLKETGASNFLVHQSGSGEGNSVNIAQSRSELDGHSDYEDRTRSQSKINKPVQKFSKLFFNKNYY